jgi:hypothetical protein
METTTIAECPFCFEQMQKEAREGCLWLVCPNGCPTEFELLPRKPAADEPEDPDTPVRSGANGA